MCYMLFIFITNESFKPLMYPLQHKVSLVIVWPPHFIGKKMKA